MGKQRKKATPLTSFNKAFAIAAQFTSLQAAEFKENLATFKKNANATRTAFGFGEDQAAMPTFSETAARRWSSLQSDDIGYSVRLAHALILDSWYKKKRMFIIPAETVTYIQTRFPFNLMVESVDACFDAICHDSIYIEFDNKAKMNTVFTAENSKKQGIATSLSQTVQGVFCGQCYINHESVSAGKLVRSAISVQVTTQENSCSSLQYVEDVPINTYLKSTDPDSKDFVTRLIVYLAFVYTKSDVIGSVLIPKTKQGVIECYEVLPLPDTDTIPNKDDVNSLANCGLSTYMGFLFRKNFVGSLLSIVNAEISQNYYSMEPASDNEHQCSLRYLKHRATSMLLQWEFYRTIYQYDQQVSSVFELKYLNNLISYGFPFHLLKYMPYETIILYNRTESIPVLISTCQCRSKRSEAQIALIATVPWGHAFTIGLFPSGKSVLNSILGSDFRDEVTAALCALCHLLTIYEQRAIKKQAKDQLMSGSPSSTSLVPVQEISVQTHAPSTSTNMSQNEYYRFGNIIEETPFELFEITSRTVKRVKEEERKVHGGWKVIPHSRRPHPHRYWVGKGADRHMEVRWLDRMHIHKDQAANKTTIHQIN